MIDINDFIILNCFGTLTNMSINAEILELTKKHIENEKSMIEELKELNRRLENGGSDKLRFKQ